MPADSAAFGPASAIEIRKRLICMHLARRTAELASTRGRSVCAAAAVWEEFLEKTIWRIWKGEIP
jgi:hypothetical protein